jgi:hypothetical protein
VRSLDCGRQLGETGATGYEGVLEVIAHTMYGHLMEQQSGCCCIVMVDYYDDFL